MRTETKIIIGIFLIVVIFCLFYGNSSELNVDKEGFTDPPPVTTGQAPPPVTVGQPALPPVPPSASSETGTPPPEIPIDIDTLDATARNLNIFSNSLSSADKSSMTPEQLDELYKSMNNEIKSLNSTIYNLSLQISQNKNKMNPENVQYETQQNLADTADIKASQLVQDSYIQKLTDRLTKLQSVYDLYMKNKNHKSYPKIPVYSSCIVSEASGTYSIDNANDQSKMKRMQDSESPMFSYGQRVAPSVQQFNPLKNIKTAENMTFDDVVNGLAQNEININFSA